MFAATLTQGDRAATPVGQHGHQGQVEAGALRGLRESLHPATAATGFRSGEPDDGKDVGGGGQAQGGDAGAGASADR